MECGFNILNIVFELEDMDNELYFFLENMYMDEDIMLLNEEMYYVYVFKEKKLNLLVLLEKGKRELKNL